MGMKKEFDWAVFVRLVKQVIDFKTKTSFTYVNADAWEEVLYFSLRKMGENPEWTLGSHAKGADIKTKKFAISAKSGKISNGNLEISSYRLTRYENVEQMADFIDDGKNYDFYLCCARTKIAEGGRRYVIYRVPADVFSAKNAKWEDMKLANGKVSGHRCNAKNGVCAKIVTKMSSQLWLSIPLSLCEKILEVEYSKEQIGSDFERIFK